MISQYQINCSHLATLACRTGVIFICLFICLFICVFQGNGGKLASAYLNNAKQSKNKITPVLQTLTCQWNVFSCGNILDNNIKILVMPVLTLNSPYWLLIAFLCSLE